jgi:hypothetical protein
MHVRFPCEERLDATPEEKHYASHNGANILQNQKSGARIDVSEGGMLRDEGRS